LINNDLLINYLAASIVVLFIATAIVPTGVGDNQKPSSLINSITNENTSQFFSNGVLMNSSWPMHCHDVHHTSQSKFSTATNPGVEKWRFYSSGSVKDTPVIDIDGTIYFVGAFEYLDRYLYAIYPNGTLKWKYQTDGLLWGSSPAIDDDGTIYIGSWDNNLYAINLNGTSKWKYKTGSGEIASSPAIAEDGTIYFGNMGYKIYALNPNGTLKWYYTTGYKIVSDPAIGDDGTVYIGSGDSYLYALNPNGTLKWRFQTGDEIHGDPSISHDGIVYIGSYDGYLYALYSNNGTMKWKCDIGYGTDSNAAIASDGTIYCGGTALYAIYPNGIHKWTFNLGTDRWIGLSSSAISADGTIYVGVNIGDGLGGEILAVNPDGSERWRKQIANTGIASSPSISEDGTVYIGSDFDVCEGYLHAFGRGELIVDANGPYIGDAQSPIQFTGTIFGGISPYTCHWDFGDGNTSEEQNPMYTYSRKGNYSTRFAVTDSEQNSSFDTANVTIDYALPIIEILKPENGIYVFSLKILPFPQPIIIGRITVEVNAVQDELGIDRVDFYVDDELQAIDTTTPYEWIWSNRMFFKHTITAVAYDSLDRSNSDAVSVWKFF